MALAVRISLILINILIGLVFIYSGYTKLLPVIETFEFTFVDLRIANWYTAPVLARLIIGFEFLLGFLLVLNYNLKKLTLPATLFLLCFFCVYLLFQIAKEGNGGNCGCFGEHLRMTPLQAIIKNIIMMALLLPGYFLWKGWKVDKNKLFLFISAIPAYSIPYFLNPVDYTYTSNNLDEVINYPLELNLLYNPEDTDKVEIPSVNLREGKYVISFLSLTCPHCRIAAKKFRLIKRNNPELPIYFILNGDKEKDLKDFYEDTKSDNIPASFALGKTFVQLAGTNLPRIYYLDNGVVVKKVDYYELNQYDIEEWLNAK